MRGIRQMVPAGPPHWVGDGFPVRSVFSYDGPVEALSPFLLLDHAGPMDFSPAQRPRGVGVHPHRGFETVTIVYDGEVAHRDSAGGGGTIGPGDVQWMTAGSGIQHEEFHSQAFTERGGRLEMAQLWVNLPGRAKMQPPRYQAIRDADIPVVALEGGRLRVIAGEIDGARGPAATHTPMNVWDLRLDSGAMVDLPVPEGHNVVVVVLDGKVRVAETEDATRIRYALLEREGGAVRLAAPGDGARLLLLSGEPLDEPVVGYGPFVMNTSAEIEQAIADFQAGRFAGVSG